MLVLVACGQAPEHPAPVQGDDEPQESPGLSLTPATGTNQACVGMDAETVRLPVDLFAVIDGSSSMNEATVTGVSKWYATKSAFRDFLEQAPEGMGLGLSLFPIAGSVSCQAESYRDAALPISTASDMVSGVLARLEGVTPSGQTPTAPALTAALAMAAAHAEQHPDRSVVVVLATDGMPTACDPLDAAALAKLAKQALNGPGHVRTMVVASESLNGVDLSGLDAVAAAGGTDYALSIDPSVDFSSQLSSALGAAAGERIVCDMAVPAPPEGEHLDYDAVNVVLEGVETRVTFPRVEGPGDCKTSGGWYYDIDPSFGAPTRINMCQATCDKLGARSDTALHVELGCKTVVH